MPGARTIDEVVARLDAIILESRASGSRQGYFAALYKRVTVAVKDGIAVGRFEDGARMERLDVIFANRYLDAYAAYQDGLEVSRSWVLAFEAARSGRLVVMQHLLLGMNAHINLDLGIAVAQVARDTGLPALRNDFLRINEVLSELTGQVKAQLSVIWPLIGLLERIAGSADDVVAEFSMIRARDSAWDFAQVLTGAGTDYWKHLIRLRDHWTATFGQITVEPPGLARVLGQLLAEDEAAQVPAVIAILDGSEA